MRRARWEERRRNDALRCEHRRCGSATGHDAGRIDLLSVTRGSERIQTAARGTNGLKSSRGSSHGLIDRQALRLQALDHSLQLQVADRRRASRVRFLSSLLEAGERRRSAERDRSTKGRLNDRRLSGRRRGLGKMIGGLDVDLGLIRPGLAADPDDFSPL